VPKRGDAVTCSSKCRQKAYRDRVTAKQDHVSKKDVILLLSVTSNGCGDSVTPKTGIDTEGDQASFLFVTPDDDAEQPSSVV
jgi:hypothetical protein